MGKRLIQDIKRKEIIKELLEKFKKKEFKKRYLVEGERSERIWHRGEIIGAHLYCFPIVPRTMEVAKEYIERSYILGQTPYSGTVFTAQTLTQAEGRYRRKWYASLGGLWFSFILYPEVESPYINLYPLAIGIACCEALREMGVYACIKWVNDLMFDKYKVGGILGETYLSSKKETYLIFGIGINVNNTLPMSLDIPAISLREIRGGELNVDFLLALTLIKLIWYTSLVREAEIKGKAYELINKWFKYRWPLGKRLYYAQDLKKEEKKEVKILGLDPYGGLVLHFCETKEVQIVYSGELT
jgi:BirA family biotin operon repressor/biotin-[acetyl-CoA-carboxylase] ligase